MSNQDFLLEIGCEELPPKTLPKLAQALLSHIEKDLRTLELNYTETQWFAAPRRLAVLIRELDTQQAEQRIERRGPAIKVAYDRQGKPTKAALGFAQSCEVDFSHLTTIKTDKGEWLYYKTVQPGKNTCELLPDIVKTAVKALPIAKPMRWGNSKIEFIRPIHWIVMLFGRDIISAKILGKQAGRLTYGHRFHALKPIKLKQASDYENILQKKGLVIADFKQRRDLIVAGAKQVAQKLNGVVLCDADLLNEVAAIVERPEVLDASFDKIFLQVPKEALMSAMQNHQKSFPVFDNEANLLPNFIFVSNIRSKKTKQVIVGNEKVMHARLSDAAFFYQTDCKMPLQDYLPRLKQITFQKDLGNMFLRSERIAKLSKFIAEKIDVDSAQAERAGLLCKCDLMTDMVYEFPELQGTMGYYYAKQGGEANNVAEAIGQHYQPTFAGDNLPEDAIGTCVALADKLDLLVGIFGIDQKPTGDKDPFALRRAAIGIVRILIEQRLNVDLQVLLQQALDHYPTLENKNIVIDVLAYIYDRLKYFYSEQGIEATLFNAIAEKKITNLADFDQRVDAIKLFATLPEAENLAAANKRVKNILAKQKTLELNGEVQQNLFQEPAEKDLYQAIQAKQQAVKPLLEQNDYQAVLTLLAELQKPIDLFFEKVMVMTDDPKIQQNRLCLLKQLQDLFLTVADISQL